ncbi:TPR end-of-group domain-containing protein [Tuwongella immobilis]|uniref:Uncharacterized protein n=1 Tax=Tuwongella immobilis TaxID=692036 RepID=A0A6C2YRD2_9BACT|nr:hypothetical protein [Tuwongella immobilis]VIP03673.1 zn-dependent protease : Serine/threonine protein kinase OS=uncultured planctomycete GN=HGMM_F11F07C08 PE=4 SV=1: TPR_11 [Tuwongella immobilis]VTS04714.1 zn-dependent protease : Serine/threonine protein kinase OS=uncultured planctomycete GN=HGMM_F11F07C08 PE=4 SV=1: TPR_11 [Tuwongella immobilis]
MAHPNKRSHSTPPAASATSELARLAAQTQIEFELAFFSAILNHHPSYVDVLRAHAHNLAQSGQHQESLKVDQRWVQLRPADPLAHYNLACSYALTRQVDLAISTLRHAVTLGYHDFRHMRQDRDLESIRKDPRFRQLLQEYEDQ